MADQRCVGCRKKEAPETETIVVRLEQMRQGLPEADVDRRAVLRSRIRICLGMLRGLCFSCASQVETVGGGHA